MTIEIGAVLTAMADASRRRIVTRLAQGPATTGQLAELFPISRPAVSQHLKILQTADVVRTTHTGRHRWHELNPEALRSLADWALDVAALHSASTKPDASAS
ncbi:metalloregulator ArsR/SmtB family transcription factor [Kribbella sp. NPDC049584]|uniref:ArsR/SmtB family transcription factor n=1 Tax=Kribbella sp. NPDC049584 TaxID=3154833 RepID=UPI0034464EC3